MLKRALLLAAGAALLAGAGIAQVQPIDSGTIAAAAERLRPGQYLWAADVAPDGPMLVVVNVATQRLVAYRNGVPIAVSTVSTGMRGKRTPTGVFTILQKKSFHRSNLYSNAPMPFMQRLTWSGIAMHGGALPGYPASHGCIRLPQGFAKLLFDETRMGMTVVVVNQPDLLRVGPTPELVRNQRSSRITGNAYWRPDLAESGPVSIVVSGADRRMIVLRNGVQIGSTPVDFTGAIDRTQAYVMDGARWQRVALPGDERFATGASPAAAQATRVRADDAFGRGLAGIVGTGTTLLVVPDSLAESIGAHSELPAEPEPLFEGDGVIAQWMMDGRVAGGR